MHTLHLFGTDGIRDIANTGVLTPESVLRLGRVIGTSLIRNPDCFSILPKVNRLNSNPCVLVACDTRISSPMLESVLVAGLLSSDINVTSLGVAPTPALAYLTKSQGYHLGIVISASHNPATDNGIKLISPEGVKISASAELRTERTFRCGHFKPFYPKPPVMGTLNLSGAGNCADYLALYKENLTRAILGPRYSLKGITIALDCANGDYLFDCTTTIGTAGR